MPTSQSLSRGLQPARTRRACACPFSCRAGHARLFRVAQTSGRRARLALLLFVLLAALPTEPQASACADVGDVEYVVVKAGRVITVSGEEFSPGTVVIEDGKITLVGGATIEYPPAAKVISAKHQTVMPGFIHPRTRFGLDSYKRSGVHGDQKAADEVYLSEIDFRDLLAAGYTAVAFAPAGTGITGVASVYRTAGPDDTRVVAESAYLSAAVNWSAKGKKTLRGALKKAEEEIEKVKKAREEWDKKQAEKKKEAAGRSAEETKKDTEEEEKPKDDDDGDDKSGLRSEPRPSGRADDPSPDRQGGTDEDEEEADTEEEEKKPEEPEEFKPPKIDPKPQPLVDLIEKKEGASMLVHLGRAADIHHLHDVLKKYDDLNHSLFLGSTRRADYNYIVETLGESKARVMLAPWMHYLPDTTFRYNLLAKLAQAGCEISVVPYRDTRIEFLRIRERLADLIRAGLSREAALKSLTLHPAGILGLADRIGSLQKDRDADLVFFNGDPLDPHTRVERVMILGEIVWTANEKP